MFRVPDGVTRRDTHRALKRSMRVLLHPCVDGLAHQGRQGTATRSHCTPPMPLLQRIVLLIALLKLAQSEPYSRSVKPDQERMASNSATLRLVPLPEPL